MKYEGVRTQLCRCRTQPNYINEAYVLLGHATFLCPGTQRTQRKIRRLGRLRLLSMKSDFSVLYLLYVLLGTLTNTLHCPGATETQGNASERRTRLNTVVAVLCLTKAWRQPSHACLRDKGST